MFRSTGGPGIQLLDKNLVCEKFTNDSQWAFSLGAFSYSTGTHTVRLKVEKSKGWTMMGIVSQSVKMKDPTFYNTPSAYGWFVQNQIYANGVCTNKTWTAFIPNDIFKLVIDCDEKKLKIINERTQQQDELAVDKTQAPMPWCLLVILYQNEDRVRLL